jgi:hypothetical protein
MDVELLKLELVHRRAQQSSSHRTQFLKMFVRFTLCSIAVLLILHRALRVESTVLKVLGYALVGIGGPACLVMAVLVVLRFRDWRSSVALSHVN